MLLPSDREHVRGSALEARVIDAKIGLQALRNDHRLSTVHSQLCVLKQSSSHQVNTHYDASLATGIKIIVVVGAALVVVAVVVVMKPS